MESAKHHVIVISLDAMITTDLEILKTMSQSQELFSRYSQVDEMFCTFPTLTYPCHATIMTGCSPNRHGIIHNELFSPGASFALWNSEHHRIQVPTMLHRAHERGLKTASVSWPTTVGSPVNYLIPEIWPPREKPEQEEIYRRTVSPLAMPIFLRYKHLLNTYAGRDLDIFSSACAAQIIRTDFPDLLFLHLAAIDCSRHNRGVATEKNLDALQFIDQRLGEIIDAVKETGSFSETDFVILSDHGQIDCTRVFNINRVLKDLGYITLDDEGKVQSWQIYCHTGALSAFVYTKDIRLEKVKDVLESIRLQCPDTIDRIFTKPVLEKLYACSGPFSFAIEASEGTYLAGGFSESPYRKYYRIAFPMRVMDTHPNEDRSLHLQSALHELLVFI